MNTRSLFAIAVLALMTVNCTQTETSPLETTVKVEAVMENELATKTNVDETGYFTWTKGDKISIHTEAGNFISGKLSSESHGQATGFFTYSYTGTAPVLSGIAVYPYNAGHAVADNALSFVMPASYDLGNTYSNTNVAMLANKTVNNEDQTSFVFNHLAGAMRFEFKNAPVGTSKFELTLGGKKLNGTFTVDLDNPVIETSEEASEAEQTTTLNFTPLAATQDIVLFVPVPVGTYQGINAKLYDETGEELGEWGANTASNNVKQRGLVLMSAITFSEVSGGIENNVNVATEKQLTEAVGKGGTITLTEDITISEKLNIVANTTIIGGGHTLTYTGSDRAINVNSPAQVDLTIKDLTVYCSASYCQRGINYNVSKNLVLDNVTVYGENVTYAVNLPGSSDNATVTINECTLTGNIALNIWGENAVITITDSELTSVDTTEVEDYQAIALNNDGTTSAEGTIVTVTGGSIIAINEVELPSIAVNVLTENSIIDISESTTVIGKVDSPIAVVLYEGYDQFYSCFDMASALRKALESKNTTLKLLFDVEMTSPITIPSGTELNLDLNGRTISQKYECTESYNMITNYGTIKIKGDGKISFEDLSNGGGEGWGSYVIYNYGNLVVDSGTIEHLGTADNDFDTSLPINNYGGKVTINGGIISSPEFRSFRDFTAGGEIVINGGTFNGQVWMQGLGEGTSSLTINGGNFAPTANDGSSVFITNGTNDVVLTVNDGMFNTKIGCTDPTKNGVKGKVKGGIFTESAKTYTNASLFAEGYEFVQNTDGTYTLTQN